MGRCLTRQERFEEAESFLTTSRNQLTALLGEEHPRTATARLSLSDLYSAWGAASSRHPPSSVGIDL